MTSGYDLGSDHRLSWFAAYGGGPEHIGIIVWHPVQEGCGQSCRDLGECGGAVFFAGNEPPGRPAWQVLSVDPLTLSPSLLCHCGDHGFIRDGRWVTA